MDHTTLLLSCPPPHYLGKYLPESLCHFLQVDAQEVPYQRGFQEVPDQRGFPGISWILISLALFYFSTLKVTL